MAKDINISTIYFGSGAYARQMRAGMQDIIDLKGLKENTKLYDGVTVGFSDPFDVLMGFKQYYPTDTNHFQYKTPPFYVVPDMNKRCFAIQNDNFLDNPFGSNEICFNYFKAIISYTDGSNTTFYGFVTSQTQMNTANAMLFTFEIDWAHTAQLLYKLNNAIRQPFDIKQAYVARDNKHYVKSPTNATKLIDCGRGKENVTAYELPVLVEETPYEYALANLSTFSDRDIKYIRFTFSQSDVSQELFPNGINPQRDELGTGLCYGFLPLIPRGDYTYVRTVLNGVTIGSNYQTYLERLNAFTRALTLAPTCVSVELIASAPFVKSVSSLTTAQGNTGIEITFDENVVVGVVPQIEGLKDNIYLLQTGVDASHILPIRNSYKITNSTGAVNCPPLTCGYTNDAFTTNYKHENTRQAVPLEPKLAQPQFATVSIVDNMGGGFNIDPLEPNGDLETIQVIADYTGSIFKRKWYLADDTRAYCYDIKGRKFFGVNDKMNAYPLVNNAYIDYMNGRKNQVINGLAVSQAAGWANLASGLIESAASGTIGGITAPYNKPNQTFNALSGGYTAGAHSAISGAQTLLSSKWGFEAQTADLKEQANTAERANGNNAEFDVIENNGAIVRQVWRTSEKDSRRLIEYFHRYGYSVGEIQQDVSTDTMYYFDFIQCSDIIFGQEKNDKFTTLEEYIMFKECDEYIRNMYAKGVRIWHGRCPDSAQLKPQIFITPYLNTAKGY